MARRITTRREILVLLTMGACFLSICASLHAALARHGAEGRAVREFEPPAAFNISHAG
jgi:hypothetical protein